MSDDEIRELREKLSQERIHEQVPRTRMSARELNELIERREGGELDIPQTWIDYLRERTPERLKENVDAEIAASRKIMADFRRAQAETHRC